MKKFGKNFVPIQMYSLILLHLLIIPIFNSCDTAGKTETVKKELPKYSLIQQKITNMVNICNKSSRSKSQISNISVKLSHPKNISFTQI